MEENCLAIKFVSEALHLDSVNFLTLYGCQLLFFVIGTKLIKVIHRQRGEPP